MRNGGNIYDIQRNTKEEKKNEHGNGLPELHELSVYIPSSYSPQKRDKKTIILFLVVLEDCSF